MLIKDGSIALAASYRYVEQHTESASLTAWVGNRPGSQPAQTPGPSPQPLADRFDLSSGGRTNLHPVPSGPGAAGAGGVEAEEDQLDPKTRIAKLIIELLTGHRIKILDVSDLRPDHAACERGADPAGGEEATPAERAGAPQPAGWGIEYHEETTYAERQDLSLSAQGVVRTKDGQEIRFSLELQVTREFFARESLDFRAGDAVRKVDPLVINFDGLAAELSSTTFKFDLDANGTAENIHFVTPGRGFLALDLNGDGEVTDGSELFGPSTGDGFRELAAYDADSNGWIDEADPVYEQLRVWTRDDGGDRLTGLAQAGVGAICLKGVEGRFDLKDQQNRLTGSTRQMGIYLRPDGQARSVQQIDLAV